MLTENSKLREDARRKLEGKWSNAVLMALVYSLITSATTSIPIVGQLAVIFLLLPINWGFEVAMLEYKRGHFVDLSFIFSGFQQYQRILTTKFLQSLYVFLWSLLLVVPGIIKGYSYAMTSFILQDEPNLQNNAAIEKSMAMMEGNKMKLFLLDLSFIGWFLLSLLTCGIGLWWLLPYMYVARAGFYEDLKRSQLQNVE